MCGGCSTILPWPVLAGAADAGAAAGGVGGAADAASVGLLGARCRLVPKRGKALCPREALARAVPAAEATWSQGLADAGAWL